MVEIGAARLSPVPTYDRDGLVFDHDDTGPADAPAVVLLHGFPQNRATWSALTPHLVAAGYRVLAPDQRGYSPGARPTGRAAYRQAELVADVLALLDTAGVRRAHVVGHDWGGVVGWSLGASAADRLHSLTVVSTPHPRAMAAAAVGGGQALRSWYAAAFQLPVLPEWLLTADGGTLARQALQATGLDPGTARAYTARLATPAAMAGALAWYRAVPLDRGASGPVDVPTRYVWGSADPALGRAAAVGTAEWVRGPYQFDVLDGVGHWIPEREPDLLAHLVLEHVRSVADR